MFPMKWLLMSRLPTYPLTTIGLVVLGLLNPIRLHAQTGQIVPPGRVQTISYPSDSPPSYESMNAPSTCNCGAAAHAPGCCPRQPAPVYICPPQQATGIMTGERPICITAVDSAQFPYGEKRWGDAQPFDFQPLWHGEYIGPVRLPSMLEYRLRVNDELIITFLRNRRKQDQEYRLKPGDEIAISSITDERLLLPKVPVMSDGNIIVGYLGPVPAEGKTLVQLRKDLEQVAKRYVNTPAISVEPVKLETEIDDLRAAVNNQFAAGGPSLTVIVNPDGRIQLVGLGGVNVLGMTIEELKRELNLRYRDRYPGIEVEPRLSRLAPHGFWVGGEVNKPGRQEATSPTTVLQALSNADPKITANMRQVVVYRRAEDWRLIATMLDLRGAQLGKRPSPSDEIWLRDSDLIWVPQRPISRFDNFARLVFTDGLYRIVPFQGVSIQSQR